MTTSLPAVLPDVSESTLKNFLRLAAGNFTVDQKNELPKIVETKGRCIRVHVTGFAFSWHDKAELLLGACNPCEEFRVVDGSFIMAKLKTDAQLAADDAAFDIDEVNGELKTYWPFFDEDAAPVRSSGAKALKRKAGKKIPEGAATTVMKMIEKHMPVGAIDTDELIMLTKKGMTPRLDKEGKDRTKKYIRAAIDKLVELEFLHVHGDEQDQVSLTAVVELEEDA